MRFSSLGKVFALCLAALLPPVKGATSVRAEPPAGPATAPATRPAIAPVTQPASPSARLIYVQVARPVSPQLAAMMAQRRPGSYQGVYGQAFPDTLVAGGVDLAFVVRVPDRRIIACGEESFRLTTLADDRHHNLFDFQRPVPGPPRGNPSAPPSNVSADGHEALFVVSLDRCVAPDAARVFVKGAVSLRCSGGEATTPRKALKLRAGQRLDAGPVVLTIKEVTAQAGAPGTNVAFNAGTSIEAIRDVKFFDGTGHELAARVVGRADFLRPENLDPTSPQFVYEPNRSPAFLMYYLPGHWDDVSVEVKYLADTEALVVPVDLRADVGVGATNAPIAPATEPASRPAPATAPAAPLAKVELLALTLGKPAPPQFLHGFAGWPEPTFPSRRGTVFRLLLSLADGTLIGIDPGLLRVDQFGADKGPPLSTAFRTVVERRSGGTTYSDYVASYGPEFSINKDKTAAVFLLEMLDGPPDGASRLSLRGMIPATVGYGEKVGEQKDVPLKLGSIITAGPVPMTIRRMSGWAFSPQDHVTRSPGLMLTVGVNHPLTQVKAIQFYDETGAEIPATLTGVLPVPPMRFGGEYSYSCILNRDAERATVKVTYFEKVETIEVPIDLATGVGL